MPYIKQSERVKLDQELAFLHPQIETLGQFTYVVYKLAIRWVYDNGVSYKNYASIIGALTCTIQELYRKQVAIYEEEKELENGSIH